jgi:NAD(P)H dehydrogenase (quinone)
MSSKRVLIIAAHPSQQTFGAALAKRYADSAQQAGHTVQLMHLDQLAFDPVLHAGYRTIQPLETDLQSAQTAIQWAEHITFVYPVWWGSVPARLKGFIDRVFLPGFAFKYQQGKNFPDKLLAGRTAHLLVTMDTPGWFFKWGFREPAIAQMTKPTLGLCGIRTQGILRCAPVISSTDVQRGKWLSKAAALATTI